MIYLNKMADFIGKWILISLGVITGLFAFVQAFDIKVNTGILIMVAVVFAAIFLGVLLSKKKFKLILVIAIALGVILFALINAKAFVNGIYSISNSIIKIYGEYYDKDDIVLYDLKARTGMFSTIKAYNTLVLSVIAIVYAYILTLATSGKICTTIHMVLSVVFYIPGMILGEVPGIIIVSLLIFYYLSCFMFWHNKRVYLGRMLVLFMGCLIITLAAYFITPPKEYYASGKFEKNKEKIDRLIADTNVDTLFENISDFVLGKDSGIYTGDAVGGISGGELGDFSTVKFKNIEMLRTRFQPTGNSIYLKGYACNEYMGDHWETLAQEKAEIYEDAYMHHANLRTVDGLEIYDIDVEYVKDKNKYRYVPYMNNVTIEDFYHDLYAFKEDRREYSYMYATCSESQYSEFWGSTSFEGIGNHSLSCYENVSMDVPDNIRELFDEILDNPVYFDGTAVGLDNTINYVKGYLEENTEYSLSPGKLKKGEDFVEDFLTVKKKGYCTAYASTAVLMFRYLGIPARYAEGYLISESDYTNKAIDDEGYVTLSVKDSYAHAWPEIYIKGVGVMPVEVTPSYYDGSGTPSSDKETTTKDNTTVDNTTNPTTPDETTSKTDIEESSKKEEKKTSGDKSGTGKNTESKNGQNNNADKYFILFTGLVVLLIASVVIYKLLENRKINKYKTEDLRINVKVLSDMFVKYLKKIGIELYMDSNILEVKNRIDGRILMASNAEKLKDCKYITNVDSGEILNIIMKAKYSRENIQLTEEEYQKVRQYVEEFKKSLQYLKNKV